MCLQADRLCKPITDQRINLTDEVNFTVDTPCLERKHRIVVGHHLNVCAARPKSNDQCLTLRTLVASFTHGLQIKTFAAHCCST